MKIVLASVLLVVLSWSAQAGLIRVSDESIVSDLSTESSLVLDVRDGQLFGALNVDVLGTLYDVAFVDGVFSDIFGEDGSKLDATTSTQASAFSSSLHSLVLIDSGIGLFDSAPQLTNGCNNLVSFECDILTAYDVYDRGSGFNFRASAIVNTLTITNSHAGSLLYIARPVSLNMGASSDTVFADWSLSPARSVSVPSPSGLMLLGLGVAGLMLNRRKVLSHHQGIIKAG